MTDETGLKMACASLAMQINDYGHTAICWRDQVDHGVEGCASIACLFARKALGIEHLDGAVAIRETLNRHHVALEDVIVDYEGKVKEDRR